MNVYKKAVLIFLFVFIVSCDSGNDDSASSSSSFSLRTFTTPTNLENHFKQILLGKYGTKQEENVDVDEPGINDAPAAVAGAGAATGTTEGQPSFSTTNLIEDGVDEADRIKTDGNYIYITSAVTPNIKIFKVDNDANNLVKEIREDTNSNGLYLHEDQLITLSSLHYKYAVVWFDDSYGRDTNENLFFYDVKDPENPIKKSSLKLDGSIISTRKIGSNIYLALKFTPAIPDDINTNPTTDEAVAANIDIVNELSFSDFMPKYQLNSKDSISIFNHNDCYVPEYASKKHDSMGIVGVISIDLNDTNPVPKGKCIAGDSETIYVALNSMYLATTEHEYEIGDDGLVKVNYNGKVFTDIHKFALADGEISYKASGRVDGSLGQNQYRKAFRMSEKDDILRIVTSKNEWSTEESPGLLFTLRENGSEPTLDVIARLPNEDRPANIGKPGELIYGVRYTGDMAYIVTFDKVDPLYTVNLADPVDPVVTGALEIDGFSDYLHSVGENYILGIGKDAIFESSSGVAQSQGVKLSLFDITNHENPLEVESIVIGKRGTYAAVSRSHHGLSALQNSNNFKFAMPISLHDGDAFYGEPNNPSTYYEWTQNELYRFEIDGVSGQISVLPEIKSNSQTGGSVKSSRSVIIGDYVHYLDGDNLISKKW